MNSTTTQPETTPQAPPPQIPSPKRAGQSRRAIALFISITILILAGDLLLKQLTFRHVADQPVVITDLASENPEAFMSQYPHESVVVIPDVLTLKLTINTGAVFGLGKGWRPLFIIASVIATLIIVFLFWRSPASSKWFHLSLALILAGAMGNLYDRALYSVVRDMLFIFPHTHLPFGWSWAGGETRIYPWIFNLADASLVLGVILMMILTWFGKPHQSAAQTPPDSTADSPH
jgi:signal peptidase II